jgi:hypothetical protein
MRMRVALLLSVFALLVSGLLAARFTSDLVELCRSSPSAPACQENPF